MEAGKECGGDKDVMSNVVGLCVDTMNEMDEKVNGNCQIVYDCDVGKSDVNVDDFSDVGNSDVHVDDLSDIYNDNDNENDDKYKNDSECSEVESSVHNSSSSSSSNGLMYENSDVDSVTVAWSVGDDDVDLNYEDISDSEEVNSPQITKNSRKNKKNINVEQKRLVRNVHIFLKALKSDIEKDVGYNVMIKKYGNVLNTCSHVCGISRAAVAKIIKNQNDEKTVRKPKTPTYECTDAIISTIRRVILDFYVRKEYPNLDKILATCHKLTDFPNISKSTLHRWMTVNCNLEFNHIGKKPVFLEREDIKMQRKYYLQNIKLYRDQGYYIVYTDETWASPDISPSKCWQILLNQTELKNFAEYTTSKVLQNVDGYTGGFIVKGGQGRVIINHAGGYEGFVEGDGVEDIFISKKDSADYHSSMNAAHFNNWFQNLVKCVKNKTVIVMDRAPYHRDRVPSTVMCKLYQKKEQLISSLLLRNIEKPDGVLNYKDLTKKQLIEWSNKHPVKLQYEVERIAHASGKDIKILWLPVAHCELNPIELIWSVVKGYVAKHNSVGGTKNVKLLSIEAIRSVTPKIWRNCVDHAVKVEDRMTARDKELEATEIDGLQIDEPLDNLHI